MISLKLRVIQAEYSNFIVVNVFAPTVDSLLRYVCLY